MKYNETTEAFISYAESTGVEKKARPFACNLSDLQAEYLATSESVDESGAVSYNNVYYIATSETDGYMIYVMASRLLEELPDRKALLRATRRGTGFSTFV